MLLHGWRRLMTRRAAPLPASSSPANAPMAGDGCFQNPFGDRRFGQTGSSSRGLDDRGFDVCIEVSPAQPDQSADLHVRDFSLKHELPHKRR